MSRSTHAFALLAVAAALAIAGCGSSENGNGGGGGLYGNGGGGSNSGESGGGEESSGGGSASGAYTPPAAGSEEGEASGKATVVSLSSVPKLGLVLVNPEGFTLYDFHKDKGPISACYGECAAVWPPLLTSSAPQPGNGASAAKLGTTKRKDGTTQVTYAGHPLYSYVADKKPGEANGNDFSSFGAQWHAIEGSGEEVGG